MSVRYRYVSGVDRAGLALDAHVCDERIRDIERNGAEGLHLPRAGGEELQRFAGHRARNRHDGVVRPGKPVERDACQGTPCGVFWLDQQTWLLRPSGPRRNGDEHGGGRGAVEAVKSHRSKIHRIVRLDGNPPAVRG